jgi:hypothetical protein
LVFMGQRRRERGLSFMEQDSGGSSYQINDLERRAIIGTAAEEHAEAERNLEFLLKQTKNLAFAFDPASPF